MSATGRTVGARVQQPFVYDTHAQQDEVDEHGPIMCEQLVLQPQVVVPTAVVAFDLGAALVVCLQHERGWHSQNEVLRVVSHLTSPQAVARPARQCA